MLNGRYAQQQGDRAVKSAWSVSGGNMRNIVLGAVIACTTLTGSANEQRQRTFDNSDIERVMRENPGFATPTATPVAATVYHCKKLSGQTAWANRPCHTIDATTTDVYYVPGGLNFDDQTKHAERQHRQKYPPPTSPTSLQPTAQQTFEACNKLKTDLSNLWRRHQNTQTYLSLSKPLKARQEQLGCN